MVMALISIIGVTGPVFLDAEASTNAAFESHADSVSTVQTGSIEYAGSVCENGTATIEYENTGDQVYDFRELSVLVDGVLTTDYSVTIQNTSQLGSWGPGMALQLEYDYNTNPEPDRVLLHAAHGSEDLTTTIC